MAVKHSAFLIILVSLAGCVFGQAVTFHSPVPWITLRENKIIAKTLVDTSEVKSNAIRLTLSKIENGKKKKITSKKFKTVDYSHEYELATLDSDIIGGKDYLSIDWKVEGTDKEGTVAPFGIVNLHDDDPKKDAIVCKKITGDMNAETVSGALKDTDYVTAGKGRFGAVWNGEKLGLVCKDCKEVENLTLVFDGKNGKNAFLSFSDRIISYYPKNDSLQAVYYKRGVKDEGIDYQEKNWKQEIQKEVKDNIVLIAVPWHDLAILPIDDRIFGFAVFSTSEEKTDAVPATAQKEIPGTWGNMILE